MSKALILVVGLLVLAGADDTPSDKQSATLEEKVAGQAPAHNAPPELILDLVDGSRLIGRTSVASLSLHTSIGRIEVPIDVCWRVRYLEDRETVIVHFANGDRLTGVLDLDGIDLATLFGKTRIGMEHVAALSLASLPADLRKGLVVYYTFNDAGDRIEDRSGHGHDGRALNGPQHVATSGPGAARRFDGRDDIIQIGIRDVPFNDFTFGAWVRTPVAHQIDRQATSGYTTGTRGQRYAFEPVHPGAHNAGAGLSVGVNGISVYEHGDRYMPATAVCAVDIGTGWNHIMVVYRHKQPTIYLNGAAIHTGLTSPQPKVYAPTRLGGERNYGHFQGDLDDVLLFERALSAVEVEQIYEVLSDIEERRQTGASGRATGQVRPIPTRDQRLIRFGGSDPHSW